MSLRFTQLIPASSFFHCERITPKISVPYQNEKFKYINVDAEHFQLGMQPKDYAKVWLDLKIERICVREICLSNLVTLGKIPNSYKYKDGAMFSEFKFSTWKQVLRRVNMVNGERRLSLTILAPKLASDEEVDNIVLKVYESFSYCVCENRRAKVSPLKTATKMPECFYSDLKFGDYGLPNLKKTFPIPVVSTHDHEYGLPWTYCLVMEGCFKNWYDMLAYFSLCFCLSGLPCMLPTAVWMTWIERMVATGMPDPSSMAMLQHVFDHCFRSANSQISVRSFLSHLSDEYKWLKISLAPQMKYGIAGEMIRANDSKPTVLHGLAPSDQITTACDPGHVCCTGALMNRPSDPWPTMMINYSTSSYAHLAYLCLEVSPCPDILSQYAIPMRYSSLFTESPNIPLDNPLFFTKTSATMNELALARALSTTHNPTQDELVKLKSRVLDYMIVSNPKVDFHTAARFKLPVEIVRVQRNLGLAWRSSLISGFYGCMTYGQSVQVEWNIANHVSLLIALFGEDFVGIPFNPRLMNIRAENLLSALKRATRISTSIPSSDFDPEPSWAEVESSPNWNEGKVEKTVTDFLVKRLKQRFSFNRSSALGEATEEVNWSRLKYNLGVNANEEAAKEKLDEMFSRIVEIRWCVQDPIIVLRMTAPVYVPAREAALPPVLAARANNRGRGRTGRGRGSGRGRYVR